MSKENVDVVRSIYAAWAEGGSASAFIDQDVEYVNPPYAVEPGTLHGRSTFARFRDAYDDVQVHASRFVDAGDDVVVAATIRGTSGEGRVPVDREQGYVWTIREGKAVRFRWFNSPGEALEAVGLSP